MDHFVVQYFTDAIVHVMYLFDYILPSEKIEMDCLMSSQMSVLTRLRKQNGTSTLFAL